MEPCDDLFDGDYRERSDEPVGVAYHARRHETPKAVLFEITPGFNGKKTWVPKSLLQSAEGGKFWVPYWWAVQEGLI